MNLAYTHCDSSLSVLRSSCTVHDTPCMIDGWRLKHFRNIGVQIVSNQTTPPQIHFTFGPLNQRSGAENASSAHSSLTKLILFNVFYPRRARSIKPQCMTWKCLPLELKTSSPSRLSSKITGPLQTLDASGVLGGATESVHRCGNLSVDITLNHISHHSLGGGDFLHTMGGELEQVWRKPPVIVVVLRLV